MKYELLAAALILLSSGVAAQSSNVSANPGLIKAGSPIYGVDVFVDNVRTTVGLADPGTVAYERASEMAVSLDRNDTDAFLKAENQLNKSAEKANMNHTKGLEKASQVLSVLNESVPEEAGFGISTALESVQRAQSRKPERDGLIPNIGGGPDRGNESSGVIPDINESRGGPGQSRVGGGQVR